MAQTSSSKPKKKATKSKKADTKKTATTKSAKASSPAKSATSKKAATTKSTSKATSKSVKSTPTKAKKPALKKTVKKTVVTEKTKATAASKTGHVTDTKFRKKPSKSTRTTRNVIAAIVVLLVAGGLGYGLYFGWNNLLAPRLSTQSFETNQEIAENHFTDFENTQTSFTDTLREGTSEDVDATVVTQNELSDKIDDRLAEVFPGFNDDTVEYNEVLKDTLETASNDLEGLDKVADFSFCKKQVDEQARLVQQQGQSDEEIKELYQKINEIYIQESQCYTDRGVEVPEALKTSTIDIAESALKIKDSIGNAEEVEKNLIEIQTFVIAYEEATREASTNFEADIERVFTNTEDNKAKLDELAIEIKNDLDID